MVSASQYFSDVFSFSLIFFSFYQSHHNGTEQSSQPNQKWSYFVYEFVNVSVCFNVFCCCCCCWTSPPRLFPISFALNWIQIYKMQTNFRLQLMNAFAIIEMILFWFSSPLTLFIALGALLIICKSLFIWFIRTPNRMRALASEACQLRVIYCNIIACVYGLS